MKVRKCARCSSETSKISVALSKKLFGRQTPCIYCMDCISFTLDVSVEELYDMAEEFKEQGCALFL